MTKAAAGGAEAHMVDDSGGTAAGGGAGAGEEIIAAAGVPGIDIKMSMNINAAGHDIATCGIDSLARFGRGYPFGELADRAVFNQQILFCPAVGVDHDAVFLMSTRIKTPDSRRRAAGGITVQTYSVASQLSGIAAYIAAQVTRCCFRVFFIWRMGFRLFTRPKPITGMP